MAKLPIFEMIIDENPASDVEVSFVALVDKPAIEKNFLAFKENKAIMNFVTDAERQIISGPAMVADTLIFRSDENGDYNVFFSKETISKIALKFFKKDYQKNLNLFHDPALPLDGVTIFESFVSDKARGVEPMAAFDDLPDGTWFISAKVENPEVWAKIKSGEVKGFSVEGIFSYLKKPTTVENQLAEILNATYNESGHLKESTIMATVKEMVDKFKQTFLGELPVTAPAIPAATAPAAAPATLAKDYTLKDGTTVVNISDLAVGGVVLHGDAPAPAGDYELEDGTMFSVGDGGVITAIMPAMAAAVVQSLMSEQRVNELIAEALKTYQALTEAKLAEATKLIGEQKVSMTKQDEKIKGLFELVEELAKTATADPVEKGKNNFTTQKAQGKNEALTSLAAQLSKLKKVS